MLINIIGNATKFTDEGSIQITMSINRHQQYVLVSIKDTGIGMSEDTVSNLFQEFYKADESRHDLSSFGLGLSICKRIIALHKGKIWAESKGQGKGSTFYFTKWTRNNVQILWRFRKKHYLPDG